jgi:hypothetical protein
MQKPEGFVVKDRRGEEKDVPTVEVAEGITVERGKPRRWKEIRWRLPEPMYKMMERLQADAEKELTGTPVSLEDFGLSLLLLGAKVLAAQIASQKSVVLPSQPPML